MDCWRGCGSFPVWREPWTRKRLLRQWPPLGFLPKAWKKKLFAKHIFTHVEWHMTGYTLEVEGDGPPDFVWVNRAALEEHAVPSAFARYYAEAIDHLP